MNTIERLKAIKVHFENISIEEFEQNLIKAGMGEDKQSRLNTLNHIGNVEKLCKVENYILENEKAINKEDAYMIDLLENIMDHYTYGWYILEETIFEQLKSINKFKVYILGQIN